MAGSTNIGHEGLSRGLVEVDRDAFVAATNSFKSWLDANTSATAAATKSQALSTFGPLADAASSGASTDTHWMLTAILGDEGQYLVRRLER